MILHPVADRKRFKGLHQPTNTNPQTFAVWVVVASVDRVARLMRQPAASKSFRTFIPNPDIEGLAYWGCLHSPFLEITLHSRWSWQNIFLHEPPA